MAKSRLLHHECCTCLFVEQFALLPLPFFLVARDILYMMWISLMLKIAEHFLNCLMKQNHATCEKKGGGTSCDSIAVILSPTLFLVDVSGCMCTLKFLIACKCRVVTTLSTVSLLDTSLFRTFSFTDISVLHWLFTLLKVIAKSGTSRCLPVSPREKPEEDTQTKEVPCSFQSHSP